MAAGTGCRRIVVRRPFLSLLVLSAELIVGLDTVGKHERKLVMLLESTGDGVGGWFGVSDLKTFVDFEQVVKQGREKEGGDDHRQDDGQHGCEGG